MKLEALASIIASEALALLEQKYHYRVAENHKTEIRDAVHDHVKESVKASGAGKIEELVHNLAGESLALLERKYHYRVADDHKKDIQTTIRKNLNDYIKRSMAAKPAEE